MPGTLGRRVDERVADVQEERELQDRGDEDEQQAGDKDEVGDRRPRLGVTAGAACYSPPPPSTRSIAVWKSSPS